MGKAAKDAAFELATASTAQKNQALAIIADELEANAATILAANAKDIELGREAGLTDALLDRLLLNEERLTGIANDVRNVISLNDPVGSEIDSKVLENGMSLSRRRVPLGVVGVIYEARPNVTIDIAALCLKTGNASILRGGKETFFSNMELVKVIQSALAKANLPAASVQYIEKPDRELVSQLLKLDDYVDMIIPRGGAGLHKMCKENSTIPVIIGGFGISHIFVDESADLEKSLNVVENSKVQRPSACNSLDTLLVHEKVAAQFLAMIVERMNDKVTFVAEQKAKALMAQAKQIRDAGEGDFDTEWLSYTLGVKVVADVKEAINHMRVHNASHSDAIMTNSLENSELFINSVGSAAVYVNAATRFTDGAQFGLGAEVAVSTQKLHARGPMGLEELTSYKWVGKANYLARS
ncbi:Catalyzes the NADPH-dependent reduction of L-glutamate 5-phosphate into L-glutamate 5-semialdehyde and phosphate. The product spontaneously undergoes cyclization to form 1-pyrroline-5- carboxylate [Vibrio sp. B1FIG11]|jgi:glutamate-5-semialdehyde dehydrogenase|nr:Gamma-glutamyl phosphate reductase [Vibrio campbellii]CAD7800854.1 Catalyzes the NADPH-dependent reduction of L-glutamate 5-phosphate into L-glutamate 5-semialdehyde and phosphate. The product spontaneously undergoes cyclization to form 1-pyrroline-5- carboxylate [Vibrio sp. B1FIG11]CAE6888482.1 Catalyzes the NADPH-dependent reduction of L-glutamate 5-phosphate into L-glutamate 5-semialdehyde and phosphate. The product spontaneously undergoes cyclization to form 1-pyrroline-5- carboxylate [Vib